MNLFRKDVNIEDSRLNSDGQQKIAALVKALPDEDLSMSWRSDLNVKLMAAQEAKRKRKATRKIFTWGTSLSCGVAASVLGVMLMSPANVVKPNTRTSSPIMASELVKAHQESLVLASVSAIPSATHETSITEDSYGPQDDLL